MNYIFTSPSYLRYISEEKQTDVEDSKSDKKQELKQEQKPNPTPKPVEKQQFPQQQLEPEQQDSDEIEHIEVDFTEKKNQFQKFILYYKLKQLQYHLNDQKVIRTYKNKSELIDFLKILDSFLMFYKHFNFKEASNISINILNTFKKLK